MSIAKRPSSMRNSPGGLILEKDLKTFASRHNLLTNKTEFYFFPPFLPLQAIVSLLNGLKSIIYNNAYKHVLSYVFGYRHIKLWLYFGLYSLRYDIIGYKVSNKF